MNIRQAKKEARTFGIDYFCEDLERFGLEKILYRIWRSISDTRALAGLDYWEACRDALYIILKELGEKELDGILVKSYGLSCEQVGSGRAFLQRLAGLMDGAIQEAKLKLSPP